MSIHSLHLMENVVLAMGIFSDAPTVLAQIPVDPAAVVEGIDWPSLLAASSPTLPGTPTEWDQQPFTGNGREGMLALYDEKLGGLAIRLGRSDVVDRRDTGDTSLFAPCFDSGRLPIGRLLITSAGKVDVRQKTAGGIDLWNAEGFGSVVSESDAYDWRIWTPMGAAVNVVEIEITRGAAPTVTFVADPALTDRTKQMPKGYAAHPPAIVSTEGDVSLSTQAFPGGGGYTVAWRTLARDGKLIVVSAIGYDRAGAGHRAEALASLRAASDIEALRNRHRDFWAAWWPRSAITVPEEKTQSFYYFQLYKLASAMRADGPMLDLMGPWYGNGPWPAIWWNLNVQLAYQPCASMNRVELLDSLVTMLEKNADNLGASTPAKWGGRKAIAIGRISSYDGRSLIDDATEAGNLTWTLAVAWDGYRLTGDRAHAVRLLPLMARAAVFHVARAKPGPDGKLHLPKSESPESGSAADCMYELGPMRWLLRTLVAAEKDLGWKHPDQAKWRATLENLTPFPANETGYLKGADSPVPLGHRHWSHLVTIYPLRDFDPDNAQELEVVRRSVAHWTSSQSEWRGYSGQGASSMWSLLGEPELSARTGGTWIGGPNTLYREAGPCIETPLQAAATLQERLLTWDRRGLRVFAGTPVAWREASFYRLPAPLGLTVSGWRAQGVTQWLQIKASVAQIVRVEPRFAAAPQARSAQPVVLKDLGQGWYEFPLVAGQTILLLAPGITAAEIQIPESKKSVVHCSLQVTLHCGPQDG